MKYIVKTMEETSALAEMFSKTLKNGDVVILNGDLGAGKTTFTQLVFSCLGVKEVVNSPTFAILKSYQGREFTLHHFDTYRISTEEAIEAGFDEILDDRNSVIFIEWSENIAPLLPQNKKIVNIKLIQENVREFEFVGDENE